MYNPLEAATQKGTSSGISQAGNLLPPNLSEVDTIIESLNRLTGILAEISGIQCGQIGRLFGAENDLKNPITIPERRGSLGTIQDKLDSAHSLADQIYQQQIKLSQIG